MGAQRGLGRVRGGILGGGGVGGLAGRVAGDRGVVAERAWGVNAACVQKKQLGTDPLCRHIPTTVQPFSQKSRIPTGAKEFQIGLYDPAEADLEHFWNCCSVGFLGERLYSVASLTLHCPVDHTSV